MALSSTESRALSKAMAVCAGTCSHSLHTDSCVLEIWRNALDGIVWIQKVNVTFTEPLTQRQKVRTQVRRKFLKIGTALHHSHSGLLGPPTSQLRCCHTLILHAIKEVLPKNSEKINESSNGFWGCWAALSNKTGAVIAD